MIHPDDTFTVYVDDLPQDDPAGTRPALVFRRGTAAEDLRFNQRLESLNLADVTTTQAIAGVVELLKSRLVETRHLARPDGTPTDQIDEAMPSRNIRVLAANFTALADLREDAAKKSAWPWPSLTAESAESVDTAKAGA